MATSPAVLTPSPIGYRRTVSTAWTPVLCSLVFIAFTSSTLMSGYHTQFVVNDVWKALFGSWHFNDWAGVVNGEGRKVGHFFGYGAIGLIFRNAWHTSLRARAVRLGQTLLHNQLLLRSALLSAFSIFVVASLDELHQHFLPQRVGSFGDVLRDTAGTVFLNVVWLAYREYKRRRAIAAW
jgi:VanZ family protein